MARKLDRLRGGRSSHRSHVPDVRVRATRYDNQ